MTQATKIGSCECRCREVRLRAAEYSDGVVGATSLTATYTHSDVDCENRSNISIATPFEREFPAIDEDCTKSAPVTIQVVSAPTGKDYHWGWLIESPGEDPQQIMTAGDLSLQLENTGPPVTVTGLFGATSPGDVDTEPEPGCSDLYDFPAAIELTLPESISFAWLDKNDGTDEERCGRPMPGRTDQVYDHLGNSPIVLQCYGNANQPYGGHTFGAFSQHPTLFNRLDIKPVSTARYEYWQGGQICIRVWLSSGYTNIFPGFYSFGTPRTPTSFVVIEIFLLDYTTGVPVPVQPVTFVSAKHEGPLTNGYTLWEETADFLGVSEPTYIVAPNRIVGGSTFADHMGWADAAWNNSTFYFSRWPQSGYDGDVCEEFQVSDVWMTLFPQFAEGYTNNSYAFSIAPTSVAQNDDDDCECLDKDFSPYISSDDYLQGGYPQNPTSANSYLNTSGSLSLLGCSLDCSAGGRTVDCFPKRVRLTLPSELNFTGFYDADCGTPLNYSGWGTGLLTADAALNDRYVLEGSCATLTLHTAAIAEVGVPWKLNENYGVNNEAWSLDYNLASSSPCFSYYGLRLYVGYIYAKGPPDPANTYRLFTQCRLSISVRLASGTLSPFLLHLYAVRLGPEIVTSDYTTTELQSYAKLDNNFNWQHEFSFSNFCLGYLPGYAPGDNYGGTGCPSPPSPPSTWGCPIYSLSPNYWYASRARKTSGVGESDELCTACSPAEPYNQYCFTHRTNYLAPFIVNPTTIQDASEFDCSGSDRFIEYLAPQSP
jgi:hypothetical protein